MVVVLFEVIHIEHQYGGPHAIVRVARQFIADTRKERLTIRDR